MPALVELGATMEDSYALVARAEACWPGLLAIIRQYLAATMPKLCSFAHLGPMEAFYRITLSSASGGCLNGERFVITAISFVRLRFPCEKE